MAEETAQHATHPPSTTASAACSTVCRARLHLRIGWWSVLVFLSLGVVLEGIHLFQVDWYFAPAGETTRLMWTLAHVHGTLLGLVHLAFGASVYLASAWCPRPRRFASYCLLAAGLLLPAGFFLGGVFTSGGDPSMAVALVPVGALALFVGIVLTARGVAAVPEVSGEPLSDSSHSP